MGNSTLYEQEMSLEYKKELIMRFNKDPQLIQALVEEAQKAVAPEVKEPRQKEKSLEAYRSESKPKIRALQLNEIKKGSGSIAKDNLLIVGSNTGR